MQLVFIELRNLSFEAQQDGIYQGSAAARQPRRCLNLGCLIFFKGLSYLVSFRLQAD